MRMHCALPHWSVSSARGSLTRHMMSSAASLLSCRPSAQHLNFYAANNEIGRQYQHSFDWQMKITCSPIFSFSIRQFASRYAKSQHGNTRGPAFRASDYQNINDLLRDSITVLDSGRPLPTGAVWTGISRMMSEQQPCEVANNPQLEQQLAAIFKYTMGSLDKMKPKDLATVILSIAKIVKNIREASQMKRINVYHQALGSLLQQSNPFGLFAVTANRKLIEFDARHLSNVAYAYALVGYNPIFFDDGSNLFQKIGDRSLVCTDQFEPQGLANLVWAYATLDEQNASLFEAVGDHIVQSDDLAAFNPQNLAMILCAYAKSGTQNAALFVAVADHVVQSNDLSAFKPQTLANILWAYAKVGEHHPRLFNKFGNHVVQSDDLTAYTPQNLANILWAYAKVNAKHPALLRRVGDSIVGLEGSEPFKPQELANIVWAYAKVGENHPNLFQMIGHSIAAVDDLGIFDTQNLANIAWAYAKTKIDASFLFNERFVNELLERQHQFNDAELTQLYQLHVWQVMKSNDGLPSPLKEKCMDAYSRISALTSLKH